jgi:hypothetical protein
LKTNKNVKKMKKIVYIASALVLVLTGCAEEYDLNDRGLTVEELPGYVAFDSPGTNVNPGPVDVTEDEGTLELNVEVPTGTLTTVTVNYSFSGTAVFGTDFIVDGATSAGGTLDIALPSSPAVDGRPINDDIVVELLLDDVADGDKTLIVTLDSASNAEGALAVGRGGTDFLKSTTVNIIDID